jgi:hypothetical protein
MGWFADLLLSPLWMLLYSVLVIAPLHILNGIYHIFIVVCGANLGSIMFGAKDGSLE